MSDKEGFYLWLWSRCFFGLLFYVFLILLCLHFLNFLPLASWWWLGWDDLLLLLTRLNGRNTRILWWWLRFFLQFVEFQALWEVQDGNGDLILSDDVGRRLAITSTSIVAVICWFKWLVEVEECALFLETNIFVGFSKVSNLGLEFSLYPFETLVVMSLFNLIYAVLNFVVYLKQHFALKGN